MLFSVTCRESLADCSSISVSKRSHTLNSGHLNDVDTFKRPDYNSYYSSDEYSSNNVDTPVIRHFPHFQLKSVHIIGAPLYRPRPPSFFTHPQF